MLNTSQGRQETEDPGVGFGDDECHGNNGCLCGSTRELTGAAAHTGMCSLVHF